MTDDNTLNGIQFHYTEESDPDHHYAYASREDPDKPIGHMWWSKRGGTIRDLHVVPEERRKGVAWGLLQTAKQAHEDEPETFVAPRHSRARTEAGTAWAKSVGGYVPPSSRVGGYLHHTEQ